MKKIKEQENIGMLGCFGIFKESFRLIFTYPLIFLQITLITNIIPLSSLFLVDNWYPTIHKFSNLSTFQQKQVTSPWYNNIFGSTTTSKELLAYLVIQVALYIVSIISSLFSISTIVYTISCIYNNQEITFNKVIKVVPKVWKPFMITYLSRFFITTIVYIPFLIWVIIAIFMVNEWKMIIMLIGVACFLVTTCCLGIMWQLSDAISVMEKICGFEALKKSRALIKGKTGTALTIFFAAMLSSVPTSLMMVNDMHVTMVGNGVGHGVIAAYCYQILGVIWLSFVSLFFIVTHGVFYFVCKSYHQEDVDDYLGEYVSLKGETE